MSDPKTEEEAPPQTPSSLGAVSLNTGRSACAKTAAEVPAARRKSDEEDEPLVAGEPAPRRVALRFKLIVGLAVSGCVAILVLAGLRTLHRGEIAHPTGNANSAVVVAPVAAAPAPAAVDPPAQPDPKHAAVPAPTIPAGAPSPAVHAVAAPLATPHVDAADHAHVANRATIRAAHANQSLTVDGKHVSSPSVTVTCGSHMVAVGTEKPRRVEAPCGQTVIVDVGKSKLAKHEGAKHEAKGQDSHAHGAPVPPKKH